MAVLWTLGAVVMIPFPSAECVIVSRWTRCKRSPVEPTSHACCSFSSATLTETPEATVLHEATKRFLEDLTARR